jgi:hypothetical protein
MCRPEELEQLICGKEEIDFNELELSVEYDDGYNRDHPIIK